MVQIATMDCVKCKKNNTCKKIKRIILEVEGGVWARQKGDKSRHFNGTGILNDMEKYNWLSSHGYILIRVQPSELLTKGYQTIQNILNNNQTK